MNNTKVKYNLFKVEENQYLLGQQFDEGITVFGQSQKKSFQFPKSEFLNVDYRKKLKIEKNISYEFLDTIYYLPKDLSNVVNCLKNSQKILTLKDDWDGEGSVCFSNETWEGVVSFLIEYSKGVFSKSKDVIDIPKVYPSLNGSIDIDWETNDYGILINIDNGGNLGTFYADDKKNQKVEGEFNPRSFNINLLPKAFR